VNHARRIRVVATLIASSPGNARMAVIASYMTAANENKSLCGP